MLAPVILNLLQTVYAAVRLDLGIDSPNNYILHKEVMPQTLNSTFPVTATTPANPNNIGLTTTLMRQILLELIIVGCGSSYTKNKVRKIF